MKKFALLFLALVLDVIVTGCGPIVTPSLAALADSQASNHRALAKIIVADPAVPTYVKQYAADNASQSTYWADWANGRQPSTQPAITVPVTTQPATQP